MVTSNRGDMESESISNEMCWGKKRGSLIQLYKNYKKAHDD